MVFAVTERAEEIGLDGPRMLDGRLAWLSNGRCRYEEALAAAEQGSKYPDDLGLATWSVVELIEAAVRSGRSGDGQHGIPPALSGDAGQRERLGSWRHGPLSRTR